MESMRRMILISIIATMFIAGLGLACSNFPEVKYGDCGIWFDGATYNDTEIVRAFLVKSRCSSTPDDREIIIKFITNGYSVVKQTDDEYKQFLLDAINENAARPADCQKWIAVARNSTWTGYVNTEDLYENGECIRPGCDSPKINVFSNDLDSLYEEPVEPFTWAKVVAYGVVLLIVLAVGAIILFIMRWRRV